MSKKFETDEQKFQFLMEKIKLELALALKKGSCNEVQMIAFLELFKDVKTYWDLRGMLALYMDQFVFLKSIDSVIREIQKADVENYLISQMPQIMKEKPEMVGELTAYAAKPGVTLVELFQKYKKIKN